MTDSNFSGASNAVYKYSLPSSRMASKEFQPRKPNKKTLSVSGNNFRIAEGSNTVHNKKTHHSKDLSEVINPSKDKFEIEVIKFGSTAQDLEVVG